MKNSTKAFDPFLLKKGVLLFFTIFSSFVLQAQSVSISGPEKICPGETYTFTANGKDKFGSTVNQPTCAYIWEATSAIGTKL